MTEYVINLDWKKTSADFSYEKFNRDHVLHFGGEQTLKASASVDYFGNADMSNPEELLASGVANCHMLTFLAIASKSGYVVESYSCKAEAFLGKNEEGRMVVTEINLFPKTAFSGGKIPTEEQLKSMHDKAHKNCFISQSLKTKINTLL